MSWPEACLQPLQLSNRHSRPNVISLPHALLHPPNPTRAHGEVTLHYSFPEVCTQQAAAEGGLPCGSRGPDSGRREREREKKRWGGRVGGREGQEGGRERE
jgi:hypothetical protein